MTFFKITNNTTWGNKDLDDDRIDYSESCKTHYLNINKEREEIYKFTFENYTEVDTLVDLNEQTFSAEFINQNNTKYLKEFQEDNFDLTALIAVC